MLKPTAYISCAITTTHVLFLLYLKSINLGDTTVFSSWLKDCDLNAAQEGKLACTATPQLNLTGERGMQKYNALEWVTGMKEIAWIVTNDIS